MPLKKPYSCGWCSTGKPLWVKEPFRNPNCKVCALKPSVQVVNGVEARVRSPEEIKNEWLKKRFKGQMRYAQYRPKPAMLPDRRDGRSHT